MTGPAKAPLLRLRGSGHGQWQVGADGSRGSGPLGEVPAAVRAGAVVLVPGEDVLVTTARVVARQRHRLLQAVPFALEDLLASDVEGCHFALGRSLPDHRHEVAVVARERISGWLAELAAAGIEAIALLPDTMAVPEDPESAVAVLDGDRVLLRHGDTLLAVSPDELADCLALAPAPRVRLLGAGTPPALPVAVDRERSDVDAFSLLAESLATAGAEGSVAPIDLRQGAFAPRRPAGAETGRRWFAAALVAAVAVLAESAARGLDAWASARRASAIEAELATILTDRFPEIRRVVDPRIQMRQAIDELRGTGGRGGALGLLRLAGPALAGDEATTIEALSFRDGELLVSVEAGDLQRVEALRQRLLDQRLAARIESGNTLGDRATARVRIGGAP